MDFDLSSIQIKRPPKRGVALLGPGKPWKMNACLHFSEDMTHGYVEGYRKGAERLIEYVEQTQNDQDYLVYPILFLYRHHLELRLKELLNQLYSVGSRNRPAPNGHDLLHLWSECTPNLRQLFGEGEKEWFSSVTRCIKQLAANDPLSEDFRYPRRRDGARSAAKLKHVNLSVLRETMDSILDWLFGASCALSDYHADIG